MASASSLPTTTPSWADSADDDDFVDPTTPEVKTKLSKRQREKRRVYRSTKDNLYNDDGTYRMCSHCHHEPIFIRSTYAPSHRFCSMFCMDEWKRYSLRNENGGTFQRCECDTCFSLFFRKRANRDDLDPEWVAAAAEVSTTAVAAAATAAVELSV